MDPERFQKSKEEDEGAVSARLLGREDEWRLVTESAMDACSYYSSFMYHRIPLLSTYHMYFNFTTYGRSEVDEHDAATPKPKLFSVRNQVSTI